MKAENKVFVKTGLLTGLLYAVFMAGFNYFDGEPFAIYKSLFHFFFFGLSMGLLARYNHIKTAKRKDSENK